MIESIIEQLIIDEGLKINPYRDTEGWLTIGIGRCLDKKGITKDEAIYLARNDVNEVIDKLNRIKGYKGLTNHRQKVIVNMTFNLGFSGVMKFRKMWNAIEKSDFDLASKEMLNSKWATQVGNRAKRLANEMRSG
ncbi:MAG: glycoside hydrolase family protein [Colwellia sp.]|nr:glycoside hydrolase family protein [Colwellia sp.]